MTDNNVVLRNIKRLRVGVTQYFPTSNDGSVLSKLGFIVCYILHVLSCGATKG